MNLTKMTRVSIFRNRRRFFLSFFLFLFLFLSLFSKRRRTVCQILYVQRWLVHRMTNRHGGIRSLASVYLWSDITAADRRAGESDLPLEMAFDRRVVPRIDNQGREIIAPISRGSLFFFSPSPCPSRLNPFPLFLCFPLIPRDRSMRHARTPNITFVCCSVWGRCMDGDERREWKNFAIFIVLREILNSMIKIIASNNNLGAF